MLATVSNNVIANSTINYQYDVLGRTTNRQINGAANSVTWAYDAMSRVTSESIALFEWCTSRSLGSLTFSKITMLWP
jgi:hypothetical protein